MKILHLQMWPCMRMQKIAQAIRKARPAWSLEVATNGPHIERGSPFNRAHHIATKKDVIYLIEHGGYDLVHSHNEPDVTTLWALEAEGPPVVHDVHDLTGMRTPEMDHPQEKEAQENADAVVYATPGFMAWARERYDVRNAGCVPSAVGRSMFTHGQPPATGKPSIAYQGGIGQHDDGYPYRRYFADFAALDEMGFKVGIYPSKPTPLSSFRNFADVYQTKEYPDLILALARYHFAFVGFAFQEVESSMREFCHACLPNKFFDAMAAGIPVIVRNCRTVADIVRQHGIGVVWEGRGTNLLQMALRDREAMVKNVLDYRKDFSMESYIACLVALYEGLA